MKRRRSILPQKLQAGFTPQKNKAAAMAAKPLCERILYGTSAWNLLRFLN
jgi:hypothetical protein